MPTQLITVASGSSMVTGNAPAMPAVKVDAKSNAVEDALREVLPDSLTPKAALELIYALKALLNPKS